MASHRRLLSAGDLNVNYVCVNCSGTCMVDLCVPAFPPLGVNSADGDLTPIKIHSKHRLVPNLIIAASALLAASFLLLVATYAVHRFRRRRRRQPIYPAAPPHPPGGDGDELLDEGEVDHHVWHIRTVGLDEATIRSIATCVYSSKDGLLSSGADCAVCLAELRDGELLRLLPKCDHAFHLPCIDTWLRSHVNCPLCRAPILAPPAAADPVNPALLVAVDLEDLDTASSALVENTQIYVGSESDQVGPEEEFGNGVDPAVASSSSPPSSELPSSLGEDGLQPVRRSVSMDSSSLAALLLRVEPEERSGEERKEPETRDDRVIKNKGKLKNAGKGASLQKGPMRVGRSLSSRSGRFFLSRYGRARNSILPL